MIAPLALAAGLLMGSPATPIDAFIDCSDSFWAVTCDDGSVELTPSTAPVAISSSTSQPGLVLVHECTRMPDGGLVCASHGLIGVHDRSS